MRAGHVDFPLPIVTARLMLALPKPGDGVAVAAAMKETWDAIFPWFHAHLGAKDDETDALRKEAFLVRSLDDAAARRRLLLLGFDRSDGSFVIWSGFPIIDWAQRRFEIDYWVARSKQGRGFAQEAVNGCLRYAFSAMDARAVTLGCAENNAASIAVARRLGFAQEARKPNGYAMPDGRPVDWLTFGRTGLESLPPLEVSWR